jgi:hypothetical protein
MRDPLGFERIPYRTCEDWRLHTVAGEAPRRT